MRLINAKLSLRTFYIESTGVMALNGANAALSQATNGLGQTRFVRRQQRMYSHSDEPAGMEILASRFCTWSTTKYN